MNYYLGPKPDKPENHSDHLHVVAYEREHGVLPGGDAINSSLGHLDQRSQEDRAVLAETMHARLGSMAADISTVTATDRAAAWQMLDRQPSITLS